MTDPGPLSSREIDRQIEAAAKSANYEEGFGVKGCDLEVSGWWVAYTRQSLRAQSQNNRLAEYLRTLALEAKKLGVIVPRELIFYDVASGGDLDRPGISHIRQLFPLRKIEGVLSPAIDKISREPYHLQILEEEATHYGVRLHYADAPRMPWTCA